MRKEHLRSKLGTLISQRPSYFTGSPQFAVRAIWVFSAVMALFAVGLWFAAKNNPAAQPALTITLSTLVIVIAGYAALTAYFPATLSPMRLGDAPLGSARYLVWWIMFGVMVLGVAALFWYAPSTAAMELVRHILNPSYISKLTDIEIRLATSLMPGWAEALLEVARRFAAPYCILEFFLTPTIGNHRKLIGVALIICVSLFVFSTLDRAIPAFYFAMLISGLLIARGTAAFRSPYLYLNIFGIIAVVVLFKNIQYGEIRSIQYTQNSDITRSFEHRPSVSHTQVGTPTVPPTVGGDKIVVLPSSPPQTSPAPSTHEAEGTTNSASKGGASAETKPGSGPSKPDKAAGYPSGAGKNQEPGWIAYAGYAASSVLERVLLSPVAMTLYAVESYGENDFKHWSATRLFSFVGVGRYVSPFETGSKKYHDAFPVTFIGDLWRNGGLRYVLPYAVFLAGVLFLIDRRLSDTAAPISLKVLSLFGVLYLFYGNAFNATSWLMVLGSLATYYALIVLAIRESQTSVTTDLGA
jgi:hypothetical protein